MTYYFDPEPEQQPQTQPQGFDADAGDSEAEGDQAEASWAPDPWRLMFTDPSAEVELDRAQEILAARDQRWTGRVIIVAALALAVFNAASLTSWASTLPPNWANETIRVIAGAWAGRLAELGLDQPRTVIRKGYEAQKAKRWK